MTVKNQVQLITYPDSLGGDLKTLHHILSKYFCGIFKGGIHILPPFPSSGDRGFAPLTYFEIEPKFGTWDDIEWIAKNYDIMLDLMVNHISRQSIYFQDFLKKGPKSEFADMFITIDKVWPNGNPPANEVDKIFLRRTQPFSEFTIGETGKQEKVWTTFGKQDPSEQIDLDVQSAITRKFYHDIFRNFHKHHIKFARLDAIGYVIKKAGTSCFCVEPEIYRFLDWLTGLASQFEIEILSEVHTHYLTQFKLANYGCWIYDFILPYMILEALLNKTNLKLYDYLKIRPNKQFTMLDCHDGIPVKPDMDELYKPADAQKLVDICLQRGANLSYIFSDKHKDPDGFDVHQIRCSYYSVLNHDDNAYIAARAIQLFVPGIPQVYYVGLLAGENDTESVKQTGEGREINRHNFSITEVEQALRKEVVQRQLKLIHFRNEYPAFNGEFKVLDSPADNIHLGWQKDEWICSLNIDMKTNQSQIEYRDETGNMVEYLL